ncbi:MAG TPA: alpha/beta hydrolase-fold protein, partial [Enhygromyxa sp.]|nr:alpha/beta hydrolase-fold protein [Enhygromyxa sp.]
QWGNDGADRFYRILRDEILPHIEAEYRVDASRRILVGHSNGGVFAWYASFRHEPPEPPLFAAAIAADCGYDEALFTLERWHSERSNSLPMRIYASQALYNGAAQKVVFDAMMARLEQRDYADLELVYEQLDTDHGGAIVPSFETGLDHALRGGQP